MNNEKPENTGEVPEGNKFSQVVPEHMINAEREVDAEAFEFAKSLVKTAGEYIRSVVGEGYETQWKADNTPVTSIDIAVNAMVIDAIHGKYPLDKVYGEEASSEGMSESGYTWVLDPIDGTQALGKLDTFTVCLARLDSDGQPVSSAVLNPSRNELFAATRGEAATLNGEPIHTSSRETIKSAYIHFGSGLRFDDLTSNGVAYDRLEGQGAKIFNTRSLAFGCIEVASGEMDGAFVGVTTPFEAASVKLIVEGAGGKVTDLYGNDPGRLDGEIRGLVVSNGFIHEGLIAALKKE